jgi:D-serine dehydratase
MNYTEGQKYIEDMNLKGKMDNSIHIAWATGGNLVPEEIRKTYLKTYLVKDK